MSWKPGLGAWMENGGVRFRVWAPEAQSVELIIESPHASLSKPLLLVDEGFFTDVVPELQAGTRYRYRINGERSLPDPASRFQPEGVHGPSEVVDPSRFHWTDSHWRGLALENVILYELHVGAFSPQGTFAGVRQRLESLKELGITAVELMPVADFPGNRNWGYDGVDLFAPARCYGGPDDLRQLVDAAHGLNMAVFLDVVYNHLGPEGAYLGAFSPYYFSSKHKSPWGDGVNLDDKHSLHVRNFFVENALHWIHEYHIDGLRLDATHAMVDDSPVHFSKELADRIRASLPDNRSVLIVAEDDRNEAQLIQRPEAGGYGLDAVWSDDLHHQVRSLLAGDDEGYFQEFSGTTEDLAKTLMQGWFYTGQHSDFKKAPRGTDPRGIPLERFVHSIQNHDQVGNRALGDRLNSGIDLSSYRAASALLVLSPATPLLFMGQEWAATSPFCYFTDHPEELGKRITEGRRNEFRHFKAFSDSEHRQNIPDPQSPETFLNSKLDWKERDREPHAGMLRLYASLIALRRTEPALGSRPDATFDAAGIGESIVAFKRGAPGCLSLLLIACLKGQGKVTLSDDPVTRLAQGGDWEVLWTTEDKSYAQPGSPPRMERMRGELVLRFSDPCAVILRSTRVGHSSS